jgi:hypothetical protein
MLGGLEAGQRRGATIPCDSSGVPTLLVCSGGLQKPFSWLSEGVKGIFTTDTEAGEETCISHFHILGAIPHVLVVSWYRRIFFRTFPS